MQEEYQVFVFTCDTDHKASQPYKDITSNQWLDFDKDIKVFYCSTNNLNYRTILQISKEVNPDFIYTNNPYAIKFTAFPLIINKYHNINAKAILAPRGTLIDGKIQFKYFKKITFLWVVRLLGIFKNVSFQATSDEEKQAIVKRLHAKANDIQIIPNLPYYPIDDAPSTKPQHHLNLIFISRISPEKNLLYLLKLLQKVNFNLKLGIIGPMENKKYWAACLEIIKKLPDNITVEYLGGMPKEHYKDTLKDYHLFVFPTFAENFGHVILEALGLGKPALISNKTPWTNLEEYQAGWALPLDQEELFVEKIRLMYNMTNEEYQQWSKGAKQYLDQFMAENDFMKLYKNLFS